jgi:hypothetical protein
MHNATAAATYAGEAGKDEVKHVKVALPGRLKNDTRLFKKVVAHQRARDLQLLVEPKFGKLAKPRRVVVHQRLRGDHEITWRAQKITHSKKQNS